MESITYPKYTLIKNGDSYVELWNDKRIVFGHFEEWGEYRYDLLSECGALWVPEINRILVEFCIELSILNTPQEYCNLWNTFNLEVPEISIDTSNVVLGVLGIILICAFFTGLLFLAVFAASWN